MTNKNRIVSTLLVLLAVAATLLIPVANADAQGSTRQTHNEPEFVTALNAERAAHGLAPLELSYEMSDAADLWTQTMVANAEISHSSDLWGGTPLTAEAVAENVGRGSSVASLVSTFMSSPSHSANILNPQYTHIGVSVRTGMATMSNADGSPWTGEVLYTTHRFAAVPVQPTPTPTPTPEPTEVPVEQAPVEETQAPVVVEETQAPVVVEETQAPVQQTQPQPTSTPVPQPTSTPVPQPTSAPVQTVAPVTVAPLTVEPTPTPEPTQVPAEQTPAQPQTQQAGEPVADIGLAPTPTPEFSSGSVPEILTFSDPEVNAAYVAKLKAKEPKPARGMRTSN